MVFFDDKPRHITLDESDIKRAGELVKMTSDPLLAGQILHDLIAQSLRHPDWRMGWFLQKSRVQFENESVSDAGDSSGFFARQKG